MYWKSALNNCHPSPAVLFIHDKHLACIGDCHSQCQLSWVFLIVFTNEGSKALMYLHADFVNKKYL